MNRAITRLFAVIVLLFAVLVAFTSRWTVFSATDLQNNPLNKLGLYASEKVRTGDLLADDGAVLAKAVRAGGGTWKRDYPFGPLFAQAVGYSILQDGSFAGLEQYRGAALRGVKTGLTSVFGSFGGNQVGDTVHTTLDPKAQGLARTLLQDGSPATNGEPYTGSVIAIVPQSGAVRVMYSNPTYNDNDPQAYDSSWTECKPNPFKIGCTFNLATQGLFPPGSTFKVVTTTAAIDSGKYTPTSIINGPSPLEVSGAPLENDGNQSWGDISLTTALINSVNTVYAQVGQRVGASVMETYMKRFGFYSKPPLDYPAAQMNTSGEQLKGKLIEPTNPNVDVGRMSIGQDKLAVTPMQMAMVVATVADGGVLMEPRLTTEVVNSEGQVVERFPPTEYDRVMKPKTASELTQMMEDVVEEGTGTPAQLDGVKVAGKTGTASTGGTQDGQPLDDAWFIGFAPVSDPKIAVAVTLENIPNGYGGTYAAPIAAKVIKTLLAEDR
jgi:peptidoglycan glycosyltransferase